jgi:AcrR family transcriptional regulator
VGNSATIEDVAKQAGVGVGTVCRHFPTKQALLDEVLDEGYRELIASADAALASTDPTGAFDEYVHQLAAHQARRRVLAEQMASELTLNVAADLKSALRKRTAILLERAQTVGAIRADISPADTSMLFAGIAQITAIVGGDQTLRDRYVAVMLDGLRPAAATPLPGKPLRYRDLDRLKDRRPESS